MSSRFPLWVWVVSGVVSLAAFTLGILNPAFVQGSDFGINLLASLAIGPLGFIVVGFALSWMIDRQEEARRLDRQRAVLLSAYRCLQNVPFALSGRATRIGPTPDEAIEYSQQLAVEAFHLKGFTASMPYLPERTLEQRKAAADELQSLIDGPLCKCDADALDNHPCDRAVRRSSR